MKMFNIQYPVSKANHQLAVGCWLLAICTLSHSASALPLVWRADWPDAKPVETLVHRGTDVELQPTWFINKTAADTNGWTFTTFCQTNAVGPWFGPLPGAFFSHTNDAGAAFYNVMVRAQTPGGAVNYTAFARLRMLDSPGFTPGELPLPVPFVDFSKVVALNAPWLLPGATNDIGTIKVELGSVSNSVSTLSAATATNSADIATINSKIPWSASQSNQLADKGWVDDEIDTYAAYYITYTAAGAAFPTRAALLNATVVYSGGAARTPTRNDYAVVLADESHGGAEWRYIYTVAAGATSGQWDAQYPIETNDYDGLSNKPQINGVSLSGNKTGADLGVLDLAGGDITGPINIYDRTWRDEYTSIDEEGVTIYYDEDGEDEWLSLTSRYITLRKLRAAISYSLQIPETSGTLAITAGEGHTGNLAELDSNGNPTDSGKKAADFAALSDIDAAISPTSPAFSNAVLSVGLGIDTNTVAVINELVDSAHDLPVSGATSVGALLLALAAAIAALKKRLRYNLNVIIIASSGAATATLADRSINEVTAASAVTSITFTFPPRQAGQARDFFIRLVIQGTTVPTLYFNEPDGGGAVAFDADDDSWADIESGVNILMFTDTAE